MKKKEIFILWKNFDLIPSQISKIIEKELSLPKEKLLRLEDIDEKHIENIKGKFERLKLWEPIEYVIEQAEFMWKELFVDKRVLIPRDETEILVKNIPENTNLLIDVWTGSGCIPVGSGLSCQMIAIDKSSGALEVAKINLERYKIKAKLINWDLLSSLLIGKQVLPNNTTITANLPYIKYRDYENMDRSVIDYEPDIALYGWDETWFELYETMIEQISTLKKSNPDANITILIEIWFDQYEYSKKYLKSKWLKFEYLEDYAKIKRVIRINIKD